MKISQSYSEKETAMFFMVHCVHQKSWLLVGNLHLITSALSSLIPLPIPKISVVWRVSIGSNLISDV